MAGGSFGPNGIIGIMNVGGGTHAAYDVISNGYTSMPPDALHIKGGSDLVSYSSNGTSSKIHITRGTSQADYSSFYLVLWKKPTGTNYTPPFMSLSGVVKTLRTNDIGVNSYDQIYVSSSYNAQTYGTVSHLRGPQVQIVTTLALDGNQYVALWWDLRGGAGIYGIELDCILDFLDQNSYTSRFDGNFLRTLSSYQSVLHT